MAGDQNSKSAKPNARQPGGRTTPVLVPQGTLAGQPDVPLDRPVTTAGSNDNARLHLVSRTVSKGHAIFVNSGGVTYVADLASRTGVLVNGKLIRDTDLKTGDRVQIGKFVFRFRSPANTAPPPPAVVPPPASVIVVGSPGKPIEGRVFQIGRRENSDISFSADAAVSAGHAVIFEMDGRWYLRDLGSRTGTIVNGKAIHQHALSFGDRIVIGSSTILFQPGTPAADEFDQPAFDPEDSSVGMQVPLPVEQDEEEAAPAPVARGTDEDAIPLADDLPLRGMDWKSAFPPSAIEPETSAADALPLVEPATDFAELERQAAEAIAAKADKPPAEEAASDRNPPPAEPLGAVLAQESTVARPVEDSPAFELPLAEPEPLELPATPLPVEDSAAVELPLADAEPPEVPATATEPIGAAAGDPLVEDEPVAATPIEEIAPVELPLAEEALLDTPPAEPLGAVPAQESTAAVPVEDSAEIELPLAGEEPAEPASIKAAVDKSVEPSDPAGSVAGHKVQIPPVTVPKVHSTPPVDLSEPLDDFVFVPAAAAEDPNAVPDLIFWGDTDPEITASPVPPASLPSVIPKVDVHANIIESVVAAVPSPAAALEVEIAGDIVPGIETSKAPGGSLDALASAPLVEVAEPTAVSSPAEIPSLTSVEISHQPSATLPVDAVVSTNTINVTDQNSASTAIEIPSVESVEVGHGLTEHSATDALSTPAVDVVKPRESLPAISISSVAAVELPLQEPVPAIAVSAPLVEVAQQVATLPVAIASIAEVEVEPVDSPEALESEFPQTDVQSQEPAGSPQDISATINVDIPEEIPTTGTVEDARDLPAVEVAEQAQPEEAADLVNETVTVPIEDTVTPVQTVEELPLSSDAGIDSEIPEAASGEEISLGEQSVVENDTPGDPSPVVEVIDEVALPSDLVAFAHASAQVASVYEAEVPPAPLTEEPKSEAGAEPVTEFVDVPAESESEFEPSTASEDSAVGEDLGDLEFVEPENDSITLSEPAGDLSGISTVTEPPSEEYFTLTDDSDLDDEPIGFEPTEIVDDAGAEIAPDEEIAPPETIAPAAEPPIDLPEVVEAEPVPEAPAPVAETPLTTPVELEKPADSTEGRGPSIFGFEFEGGSFLGGMPIALTGNPPAVPAPPAPSSPVFDSRATPPAGIGEMLAAPPVAPPQPRPKARPTTPPRPAINQPVAPDAPTSLSGLVSEARLPWGGAPVIPPTQRNAPPTPKPGAAPRKALTSNFNGAGKAPRVAEVFSQMSAPIGVEVFGGRPGDPNQFTVPDIEKNGIDQPAQAIDEAETKPAAVLPYEPVKKSRFSVRLLMLLVSLIAVPAIVSALIYKLVPVSSQVMGSIDFDNLVTQPADDVHAFHSGQEAIAASEDVRQNAQNILVAEGKKPGFTSDPGAYADVVNSQYLSWSGKTFQFVYNTTSEQSGIDQVNAVMAAIAQKDHDLVNARDSAKLAAAAAKAAVDRCSAHLQDVINRRREQDEKAQDHPDAAIVADAQQEADKLNQELAAATAKRVNTEKALADVRSQDPTKPIDIETDPQVVDLKKQLQPLLDQIARLNGVGSVDAGSSHGVGTNVPVGATTQTATPVDPLAVELQQQADVLQRKLAARRADLANEATVGIDQRVVNQSKAIENLSVQITDLKKIEADTKAAADVATDKAKKFQDLVSAARLAGLAGQELQSQQADAIAQQQAAQAESEQREAELARCVTLSGTPTVTPISQTDLRPKLAMGASIGAVLFLLVMIAGEIRRPRQMTSVTPAAAPRINQRSPLVPWPQPKELEGLEHPQGEQPPVVGEPEQVFGV